MVERRSPLKWTKKQGPPVNRVVCGPRFNFLDFKSVCGDRLREFPLIMFSLTTGGEPGGLSLRGQDPESLVQKVH